MFCYIFSKNSPPIKPNYLVLNVFDLEIPLGHQCTMVVVITRNHHHKNVPRFSVLKHYNTVFWLRTSNPSSSNSTCREDDFSRCLSEPLMHENEWCGNLATSKNEEHRVSENNKLLQTLSLIIVK